MADPLVTANAWGPPPTEEAYQRDSKVFGVPSSSLVDHAPALPPQDRERQPVGPFLRIRLGGLERNKKDLLIRFDASTNLPSFRTSMYRNIQRSYVDFQAFSEQIAHGNPQTIVPALPPPHTSAGSDEEDDRLVRIALQRWFARVCDDPTLQKDDELRNFIESDFGYQPTIPRAQLRLRANVTSSSSGAFSSLSKVFRKGPPDEDEDLSAAKGELERLEERWGKAAGAVGTVGKSRKAFAVAEADTGAKLISLATVEPNQELSTALRSMGRALESVAGLSQAQSIHDNIVLGDSLAYQSVNAKAAKETLNQRIHILEDAQSASKTAINKRRVVERMKGSSNINPNKVDDALEDMREAQELDHHLSERVQAISINLRSALQNHSRKAHEDIAVMLLEHAKSKIVYQRQILRELEAVKPDIDNIGKGPGGQRSSRATVSTGMQRSESSQRVSQPSSAPPVTSSPAAQPRYQPGMSQSMYVPPTQPTFHTSPQGQHVGPSYPREQSIPQPFGQDQSSYSSYNTAQPPPGPNIPANVHVPQPLGLGPTANTYNTMAQSMYLPGGSKAPGGYGGPKRLDDRAAARSLANMF